MVGSSGTKMPITASVSEIDPNIMNTIFTAANVCKIFENATLVGRSAIKWLGLSLAIKANLRVVHV